MGHKTIEQSVEHKSFTQILSAMNLLAQSLAMIMLLVATSAAPANVIARAGGNSETCNIHNSCGLTCTGAREHIAGGRDMSCAEMQKLVLDTTAPDRYSDPEFCLAFDSNYATTMNELAERDNYTVTCIYTPSKPVDARRRLHARMLQEFPLCKKGEKQCNFCKYMDDCTSEGRKYNEDCVDCASNAPPPPPPPPHKSKAMDILGAILGILGALA